jgi:hypothetical protein
MVAYPNRWEGRGTRKSRMKCAPKMVQRNSDEAHRGGNDPMSIGKSRPKIVNRASKKSDYSTLKAGHESCEKLRSKLIQVIRKTIRISHPFGTRRRSVWRLLFKSRLGALPGLQPQHLTDLLSGYNIICNLPPIHLSLKKSTTTGLDPLDNFHRYHRFLQSLRRLLVPIPIEINDASQMKIPWKFLVWPSSTQQYILGKRTSDALAGFGFLQALPLGVFLV